MKKTGFVSVIANKSGNVLTVSPKNPEYGWLAVESVQPSFNEQGFMRLGKRVAFISGTVNELSQYAEQYGLVPGVELPGKIVIRESLEPQNATDATIGVKYPSASAKVVGLPCMVDDQPVYRKSFYTTNLELEDVLVQHTNGDDIRAFQLEQAQLNAAPVVPAPNTAARRTAPVVKK